MNNIYMKWGKWVFSIALFAIGATILVAGHLPIGLLPVSADLPAKLVLSYAVAITLIIAAVLLVIKKYARLGAVISAMLWLLLFLFIHLVPLLRNLKDPGRWTGAFEVLILLAGSCMLVAWLSQGNKRLWHLGRYLFIAALIVFGVLHAVYLPFIVTLIPEWLPGRLFWAYLVMLVFFSSALSFLLRRFEEQTAFMLSLMFFLWFWILHLPRVVTHLETEPEWTSLFIALATSGVALMMGQRYNDRRMV